LTGVNSSTRGQAFSKGHRLQLSAQAFIIFYLKKIFPLFDWGICFQRRRYQEKSYLKQICVTRNGNRKID